MDRDKRWERVEKSYRAMVYGDGLNIPIPFKAITESYEKSVFDEFVEPTVIVEARWKPVGLVESGDSVIFLNFRPDRAIQLSKYSRTRISVVLTVVLSSRRPALRMPDSVQRNG